MTVNNGGRIHYRLTFEEWSEVWATLRPAEIKILYYLRTLDPFGDRDLEIKVRQMGRELEMSHSTVSRALKVLDAKGYIDLDLISVNVKVKSLGERVVSPDTSGVSRHRSRSSDTTSDREAPLSDFKPTAKTVAEPEPEPLSSDGGNVPEQTLKNTVNRSGSRTLHPAPEPLDGKGYPEFFQRLSTETGVPLNAALLSVLQKICQKHPEEADRRVSAAISAYLEQRETVINPQAFISAALQRGFTSNTAKRQKRTQTEKQKKTNLPPPAPADLSDLLADISLHCKRLEMTDKQALQRFGRPGRSLDSLSDLDLATLRSEMARW
ncbi:MAG: hypothetical protein AAGG53_08285 [Cyanobacteria bacterium P01_H01_bin.152]